MKKIVYVLSLVLCISSLVRTEVTDEIADNISAPATIFPLNVCHSDDGEDGYFLVASRLDGLGEHAISMIKRNGESLVPLALDRATLGQQEDLVNPLYNRGVIACTLWSSSHKPVIVSQGCPSNIIVIDAIQNKSVASLMCCSEITDGAGKSTARVIAITGMNDQVLAAAVAPHKGTFGGPFSAIAFIQKDTKVVSQKKDNSIKTGVDNSRKKNSKEKESEATKTIHILKQAYCPSRRAATPLAADDPRQSPALRFQAGDDLLTVYPHADLCWDSSLKRLYVALSVCSGADSASGARSIMVGRCTESQEWIFDAIAPESAICGTEHIVGAVGSNIRVTTQKVRVMHTSTNLPYLITLSGIAAEGEEMEMHVCALPLVNAYNIVEKSLVLPSEDGQKIHGAVANKNALPADIFTPDSKGTLRFAGRQIKKAACEYEHMPSLHDCAVRVGGGADQVFSGVISDLLIRADTVYISVVNAQDADQSGVFFSQALFDAYGRIKSWTRWRRACAAGMFVVGIGLDNRLGTFYTISEPECAGNAPVVQVEHPAAAIAHAISDFSTDFPGGVQGLTDIPAKSVGALGDVSVLVAGGLNYVACVQTGYCVDSAPAVIYLIPEKERICGWQFSCSQKKDLNTHTPVFRNAAAFDCNGQGYFSVASTDGLYMLTHEDGSGWDIQKTKACTNFHELVGGMQLKKYGDYQDVIKVWADDEHGLLYVLTPEQLDRIDLLTSNIIKSELARVTIARIEEFKVAAGARFTDMIITCDSLGVLATTDGLFRTGNGVDIAHESHGHSMHWTRVQIPSTLQSVRMLVGRSVDGNSLHLGRAGGGHVYVFVASRSQNQSQLYRFTIADIYNQRVDDKTIQLIPDVMISGVSNVDERGAVQPSYFNRYGEYRHLFATNGQLYLTASNSHYDPENSAMRDAYLYGRSLRTQYTLPLSKTCNTIYALLQESTTGGWLVATDCGLISW